MGTEFTQWMQAQVLPPELSPLDSVWLAASVLLFCLVFSSAMALVDAAFPPRDRLGVSQIGKHTRPDWKPEDCTGAGCGATLDVLEKVKNIHEFDADKT